MKVHVTNDVTMEQVEIFLLVISDSFSLNSKIIWKMTFP